jgi:hypothetical protein
MRLRQDFLDFGFGTNCLVSGGGFGFVGVVFGCGVVEVYFLYWA